VGQPSVTLESGGSDSISQPDRLKKEADDGKAEREKQARLAEDLKREKDRLSRELEDLQKTVGQNLSLCAALSLLDQLLIFVSVPY